MVQIILAQGNFCTQLPKGPDYLTIGLCESILMSFGCKKVEDDIIGQLLKSNTPTTVAKAAPEDKPNSITAVAIATSK